MAADATTQDPLEQPAVVGIGLSPANLARLQAQRPVVVRGDGIGTEFDVLLFAGESEEALDAFLAGLSR